MSRPYLTVLTLPILPAARRLNHAVRRAIRMVVKPGVPVPQPARYPGHYALVRSVVEGMQAIRADFNFNPGSFGDLGRVVYAPANEALRQAIALKRRGVVDYLVAGPVNALFADESDGILQAPEIDLVIVPSEWTIDFYEDVPALVAKSRICPCGVDQEWWKPARRAKDRTVVIYWKSGEEAFCEAVEAVVKECGLEPIRFRSRHGDHGIFQPAAYREALDHATLGVFLSTYETQGIALAEAWSMDVPTVVWDPQGEAEWRGRTFTAASSAPYLSPSTGVAFRTIGELEPAIRSVLTAPRDFQPRDWVLAHMTDAICSEQLFRLIRDEAEKTKGRR